MKPIALMLVATLTVASLSSCGKRVEVPLAFVGKVKTKEGLQTELHGPSVFSLPFDPMTPPSLILVETSHFAIEEQMNVYMPRDKMNLAVDLRGTFFITADQADDILANVRADQWKSRISAVSSEQVYKVYASQAIRTKARSLLTQYSIMEVMENRDAISIELREEIGAELTGSPIGIIRLALAEAQPPKVMLDAQESAKKREIEIQEAEADKMVKMTEADAALEIARKQQQIDLLEAETQVLVEQKLSESVNEAFVTQRSLRILEEWGGSQNKVMVLTGEVFANPSLILDLETR